MDGGNTHHYYTAVEKILAENKTLFTPRLVDFEPIEKEARGALAENLCVYRKSVNLPQARMAKIFGVSLSQYKKYETGEEIVRVDLAQKWSLRFSTPFFYLLQGSGYGKGLTSSDTDTRLNFIWFLANSLTDDYFSKLVDVLCTLTGKPRPQAPRPSGITRAHLLRVTDEIENQMYIVAANQVGTEQLDQDHAATYFGTSCIIDPWGRTVAEATETEAVDDVVESVEDGGWTV